MTFAVVARAWAAAQRAEEQAAAQAAGQRLNVVYCVPEEWALRLAREIVPDISIKEFGPYRVNGVRDTLVKVYGRAAAAIAYRVFLDILASTDHPLPAHSGWDYVVDVVQKLAPPPAPVKPPPPPPPAPVKPPPPPVVRPWLSPAEIAERNRRIIEAKDKTIHELVAEFEVSRSRIYQIIKWHEQQTKAKRRRATKQWWVDRVINGPPGRILDPDGDRQRDVWLSFTVPPDPRFDAMEPVHPV